MNGLHRAVGPHDDSVRLSCVADPETKVNGQVALVECSSVGVRFAAKSPLLGRSFVQRGVERSPKTRCVVGRARKLQIEPVVAIGGRIAEKHSFVNAAICRCNQVLIAVHVDVCPGAVVGALIGGLNALPRTSRR